MFKDLAIWATLALSVSAAAIEKRAPCTSYTIINTRGTGEAQGQSSGFRTMNVSSNNPTPLSATDLSTAHWFSARATSG